MIYKTLFLFVCHFFPLFLAISDTQIITGYTESHDHRIHIGIFSTPVCKKLVERRINQVVAEHF